MILRDIYFPPALGASGVQGFYGDRYSPEYKHSQIIRFFWGDIFHDMGFVAKTATINPNKGNVAFKANGFEFKKLLPDAIYPMPLRSAALNAVGLSNPGFGKLLSHMVLQHKTKPFMLSFMAIGKTKEERLMEARMFVVLLSKYKPNFMAKFALQVNFSCPNTGHDQKDLIGEAFEMLDILAELEVPLIPKINAVLPSQYLCSRISWAI